jgi:putative membrane protein insertion efficiency factor
MGDPGAQRPLARLLGAPFVVLIFAYRVLLSPLMGGHCRFHPSCSQYALDAYRQHNPIRASWLTLARVSRCHPFGGSGYDPVPPVDGDPGSP